MGQGKCIVGKVRFLIKTSKARKDRQILTPERGVYLSNWDSGYLSPTATLELSVGFCATRRKTVNHRNDQTRQPNFCSVRFLIKTSKTRKDRQVLTPDEGGFT
jgi:hypothetical protein